MAMLLSPNKKSIKLVCRHYTSHPLWVWTSQWDNGTLKSLYVVEDCTSHPATYGNNWVEFEATLPLIEQIPYVMGYDNTMSFPKWGWEENKGWFLINRKYLRLLKVGSR